MDAKDLRIESALGAQSNDGSTKYAPNGPALQTNGSKPYHDIGSNSLAKVDVSTARPCAIIGPDRVLPQHSTSDVYLKRTPAEPWPCTDNTYQQPPEYPHKLLEYPPSRNISPRQTFQENMQRIMVPPMYASVKSNEDHSLKNSKMVPSEVKFCDVPYTISPVNNEPKVMKTPEGLVPNNNSAYIQSMPPQGWLGSGVNVRPVRPYGAPEFYQYPEFPNCSGPRAISMIRPHRNIHEDVPQVYQDRFYPAANVRFKPYPGTKERHHPIPQARYEYITNYANSFHLHSPYTPQKYDLPKSMPPHPCPLYPAMPLKYLDKRMPATPMDRYQRSPNQQINFNTQFCNQNFPPSYGSTPGNTLQGRVHPYSTDPTTKPMIQNRLYFDNNNAHKYYSSSENMFINDMNQAQTIKNDVPYPSYPPINIHSLPHHMYRKENPMKKYEHSTHFRNFEYSANINSISRLPVQFSPQTISISPDSNTSNDTIQTFNNVQEDCGYISQSSTASIKSIESGVNRMSSDAYRHHDMRFETSHVNKSAQKLDTNLISKDKKELNVRQFLQMWNEGDDEGTDSNKESSMQLHLSNTSGLSETGVNQEQLYVLGLVTVPNEELDKYNHIQKISKLPENIKGYNSIELLNQYEKLVESPSKNHFNLTPMQTKQKDLHVPLRNTVKQGLSMLPRPLSPLDVEAKISQSVIHKEVGCNFEIRPCSPQMMNVEVATPVHNVLGERLIEKVVNPVMTKSPMFHSREEIVCDTPSRNSPQVQSCKMVNTQYPSKNVVESLKTNYCIQDLESNSGVGLASLPRLDNDIELTFPEINQQFINANKMESVKMTLISDLPVLDTENSNIIKNKIHNKPFISENINSGSESDKEVSKLSKYRKYKRSTSLHRTDSVIIKNPENSKTQEEYSTIPLINKASNDISLNPMNELQNDRAVNSHDQNFNETVIDKFDNYVSTQSVDTAIDFSFNKNVEQEIYINSMGNLTDSLHNNNDIDKKMFSEDGVTETKAEKPKKFIESSTSIELNSKQLDSVTLDNFTCASKLNSNFKTIMDTHTDKDINASMCNNKIDFKSIDEGTLLLPESVITHSKNKEKASTDDFVQQKDLSVLIQNDDENFKKVESEHNNITLSVNNDIKYQVLSHSLPDDLNDISTPIHEPNRNLLKAGIIDQNYTSDMNVENNYNLENETKDTTFMCTNEVIVKSDDPKIKCSDDTKEILLAKYDSKDAANISKHNLANVIDIAKAENKIIVPIKKEEHNGFANFKCYLGIECSSKCSNKIHINKDSLCIQSGVISKGDITDTNNTKSNVLDTHCSDKDYSKNMFDTDTDNNINTNVFDTHCSDKDDNTNTNVFDTHCRDEDDNTNTNVFDTRCSDKNDNTNTSVFVAHCSDKDDNTNTNVFDTYCSDKDDNTNTNVLDTHCCDKDDNTNSNVFDTHCCDKDDNTNSNVFDTHCRDNDDNTNINVLDAHCNDKYDNIHDVNLAAKTDFELSPCLSVVKLGNNESVGTLRAKFSSFDINEKSDSEIIHTISGQEQTTLNVNNNTTCCEYKNEPLFKKELFSPWFQNLLLYNHGFCTPIKNNDKKYVPELNNSYTTNSFSHNCDEDVNSLGNHDISVSPYDTNPSITDNEANSIVVNINMLTNQILTETGSEENHEPEVQSGTIDIKTDKVDQNEMLEDIKKRTDLIENVVQDNNGELIDGEAYDTENMKKEIECNIKMNVNFTGSVKERPFLTEQITRNVLPIRSRTLKRSLSESAAVDYIPTRDSFKENCADTFIYAKRTKVDESEILVESHMIDENFTSFIHNNRRNSISTIYNDENVSFCIVIDDDCVLADESEDCSKICYTEIPGDCLTTICPCSPAQGRGMYFYSAPTRNKIRIHSQ